MNWIRTWTLEIPADHGLKFFQCVGFDVQLPFRVRTYFVFHLFELSESELSLTNYTPRLVRVGIIADDLGSNDKSGDEEAADEPRPQPLQQAESSNGYGGRELRGMEGVSDETYERKGGHIGGKRLVWATEEVVDVSMPR
jgi:hypothetical protein